MQTRTCPACGGKGMLYQQDPRTGLQAGGVCPTCGGKGVVPGAQKRKQRQTGLAVFCIILLIGSIYGIVPADSGSSPTLFFLALISMAGAVYFFQGD